MSSDIKSAVTTGHRTTKIYTSVHNVHSTPKGKGVHLNNLWSIWYGIIFTFLQAYLAYKALKEILGYSQLTWPEGLPYLELNLSLGLNGAVFVLLPIFATLTMIKIGNLANDGFKLGRPIPMCTQDSPDIIGYDMKKFPLRHGGPSAPLVHMSIAFCLLLPKLLMETKLICSGFLPQDYLWHTDLDFIFGMSNHTIKHQTVLNNTVEVVTVAPATTAERFFDPGIIEFSSVNVTHKVIKTLKDIIGHEQITQEINSDGFWNTSLSLEYVNLIIALAVYAVRYPAVFWATNKCWGLIFSFILLINGIHVLLNFSAVTILYKAVVTDLQSYEDLNNITNVFQSRAETILPLYFFSVLIILFSSFTLYLLGHTKLLEFICIQRAKKLITTKESLKRSMCTVHCIASLQGLGFLVHLITLTQDYLIVYDKSNDTLSLYCTIFNAGHITFWMFLWVYLACSKKTWNFKIKVPFGEALIKESESIRLLQGSAKLAKVDDGHLPMLIYGDGRTYTVFETLRKKAIMDVVRKNYLVKKSKSNGSMSTGEDMSEEIYWLKPAMDKDSELQSKNYMRWFRKKKQQALFEDASINSPKKNKSNVRHSKIPGLDEDDGDYATLREIPLGNSATVTICRAGKKDGKYQELTYESTAADFNPPASYEDHSPLLESIVIHSDLSQQPSTSNATDRLVRADSGILAHDELPGRSNSLSTESSVSPPEAPGSSHSESSSGVHSNDSTDIMKQNIKPIPEWESSQTDNSTAATSLLNLDMPTEPNPESTVVIRRRSIRPNPNEGVPEAILNEDPYGRATNMRMTSFMDSKIMGQPSSSATLPHYPTQPSVQTVFNCSTMPLAQHTSGSIPQTMTNGNSCNVYPNRMHTTIPTYLDGVNIVSGNHSGMKITTNPHEMVHNIAKLEPIYTKINRATNELCHYSSNRHS